METESLYTQNVRHRTGYFFKQLSALILKPRESEKVASFHTWVLALWREGLKKSGIQNEFFYN